MTHSSPQPTPPRWDLAAEGIAVKIRWFGLLLGYVYVNLGAAAALPPSPRAGPLALNAILSLGAVYTVLDTWFSWRGKVFLGGHPLFISAMEALFIGLLCYCEGDLDSPFRYYYLLSLICCAVRHPSRITYATCVLDCVSYGLLFLVLPPGTGSAFSPFLIVVLIWVTLAATAMSRLVKRIGEHLGELNAALVEHQAQLEARIAERTRELQEAQAHVWHQEKMAGFGLLAAGIAHEVGNPLTSISTLVQMLQRRDYDDYTREKLGLVAGQLSRIQTILRELATFSRPASFERGRFPIHEVIDEALGIAKYYKGTKTRAVRVEVPPDLPPLHGVRDQLVQVVFNLVLNAIDATARGGVIEIRAGLKGDALEMAVRDDGAGIAAEHLPRVFQPYFTTKRRGTGLGLFVTRKLVAEHGGTVTFESKPGEGTVFRVRLPVEEAKLPSPPGPLSHQGERGCSNFERPEVNINAPGLPTAFSPSPSLGEGAGG